MGLDIAITSSLSVGADLLGYIHQYKSIAHSSICTMVQACMSHDQVAQYGSLSADPAHRESQPPIHWDLEEVKTNTNAIYT